MKRFIATFLVLILLSGCSKENQIGTGLDLRNKILNSEGCSFDAVVTADYGDDIYTFSMRCGSDRTGAIKFEVTDPETISGITGEFSSAGGKLTFEDTVISFRPLTNDQLTPVSAPWILLNALRSGYLSSAGKDGEFIRLSIDDSYEENALHLDVWLNENNEPFRGDVLWKGQRILTIDVRNFQIV